MPGRSYYDILEVSRDCSATELTKAYRNLALKYHPDKNPDGMDQFKEITKAYKVLNDPEARQLYDLGGETILMNEFSDFTHRFGFNWGEIRLEDLLNWTSKKKHENSVYPLVVPLETVYSGGCLRQEISQTAPCTSCVGRRDTGCPSCGETKLMIRRKVYDINIKPGILNGQEIYFIGEGNCTKDTSPGDLIFQIRVLPHSEYKMGRTRDLERTQDISLRLAVFGGMTKVKTLDHRNLCFRVRPGAIKNGTRKWIRNEGMPDYFNPKTKGNLIVTFRVNITSIHQNPLGLSELRLLTKTNKKNDWMSCFYEKGKGVTTELQGPMTNEEVTKYFQELANTHKEKFYARHVLRLRHSTIILMILMAIIVGLTIIIVVTMDEMDVI